MTKPTPEEIITRQIDRRISAAEMVTVDIMQALADAGKIIVDREPSKAQIEAGRREMPVQTRYWIEDGIIHEELIPIHECVNPANVYRAMAKDTGS